MPIPLPFPKTKAFFPFVKLPKVPIVLSPPIPKAALPAVKAFPIPPKLNMPGAYPPKEALPNRPPSCVPGIPNAAAPINAAFPRSELTMFLAALDTPLTAFFTILPNP